MAKKKLSKWDIQHLRNLQAVENEVDACYRAAVGRIMKLNYSRIVEDGVLFSFNPSTLAGQQVKQITKDLTADVTAAIMDGITTAWELSSAKNDALVAQYLNGSKDLPANLARRYLSTNDGALAAFAKRKVDGLRLSDRVWRYTDQFKSEIEMAIDIGLRDGRSADKLSRDVRAYLQNPDALFRRVRDEHGNLVLSKAAKAYHPGRGVYRSAFKNARRLASTECNIAYHKADKERWQRLDFVVGFKVVPSKNHPRPDICDDLKGDYPKTFDFSGWHPHCRCHAEPIMKTLDEVKADNRAIINGGEPSEGSVNMVNSVPKGFEDWIVRNQSHIEAANSLPYFIRDNKAVVERIMNPKKTALEIAAERHAARTLAEVEDIRKRWDKRRLDILQTEKEEGYFAGKDFIAVLNSTNEGKREYLNELWDKVQRIKREERRMEALVPNIHLYLKYGWKIDDLKEAYQKFETYNNHWSSLSLIEQVKDMNALIKRINQSFVKGKTEIILRSFAQERLKATKIAKEVEDAKRELEKRKKQQMSALKRLQEKTFSTLSIEERAAIRHAARTTNDVDDIKARWDARASVGSCSEYIREAEVFTYRRSKIAKIPVKKLTEELDEAAIIKRIGGGDETAGSCASLAFAYCANKKGLNVLDFRDGASRGFFSQKCFSILETMANGRSTFQLKSPKEVVDTMSLFAREGAEYYFAGGQHAAIIRKRDGLLEYLELQTQGSNGWYPLTPSSYKDRFGSKQIGFCTILQVGRICRSEGFQELLEFLNTELHQQVKGAKGGKK